MKKEEPIRIAHIIGKWVGGGVEAVVMNYYRHIDRNKIQFDFICDNDSTNIPYDEIEKLGGKVILIPPYQHVIKYHKELKKVLKEGKYKIVHSHINTLSVFSLFAAKCVNIPVRIAHSHSTTNSKEWKKNIIKITLRPFVRFVATDYFACTEHAAKWMFGNKSYDNNDVYVVNNAIKLDDFSYNEKIRKIKREELNIKDDMKIIGHVGRFVEQKNHLFIIDIFNELHKLDSKYILVLIGQGPLMEDVKQKIKELNLEENVKFLGQRNDVNDLYQAMDLFLFPSLYEGLGMVAIESQVSGLPCLCSTEVPKVVKINNNVSFYSLKVSPLMWANKIRELTTKSKRKNHISEVKKAGYDIDDESKKIAQKYLSLIKK